MSDNSVIDLSEKGRTKDGETISMDRRLFMQFLAYGECRDTAPLIEALQAARLPGALYADINDPRGVGLVTFSEDGDYFITCLREFLNQAPFSELTAKPEYTMLGRTYSLGYEQDLEDTLINRPSRRVVDPELPWVVWYPLRRVKSFETLPHTEQRKVLMEHGGLGMQFGKAGQATDIRLACHGLDKNDNDFVVAVLSHSLHPLSAVVQAMRRTKQTSEYLDSLGPFFIGKVIWQCN